MQWEKVAGWTMAATGFVHHHDLRLWFLRSVMCAFLRSITASAHANRLTPLAVFIRYFNANSPLRFVAREFLIWWRFWWIVGAQSSMKVIHQILRIFLQALQSSSTWKLPRIIHNNTAKKLKSQLCKHRKLKLIKEIHCHGFIETFLRFLLLLCCVSDNVKRIDETRRNSVRWKYLLLVNKEIYHVKEWLLNNWFLWINLIIDSDGDWGEKEELNVRNISLVVWWFDRWEGVVGLGDCVVFRMSLGFIVVFDRKQSKELCCLITVDWQICSLIQTFIHFFFEFCWIHHHLVELSQNLVRPLDEFQTTTSFNQKITGLSLQTTPKIDSHYAITPRNSFQQCSRMFLLTFKPVSTLFSIQRESENWIIIEQKSPADSPTRRFARDLCRWQLNKHPPWQCVVNFRKDICVGVTQ
jgi:hypothetical protein